MTPRYPFEHPYQVSIFVNQHILSYYTCGLCLMILLFSFTLQWSQSRRPNFPRSPRFLIPALTLLCLLIVPCNLFHFLPVVVAVKKMAQVSLIPAREPVLGQYLSVTTRDPILLNLSTVPLDLTPLPSHFSILQVNPIPAREPVS